MARSSIPRLPQPRGSVSGTGPGPDAAAAAGPRPFERRVIWVGGVVFAVLMALSPWYGFHRDELYFLDRARHLQASYVDQPVLTPLLAWVSLKLFGVSVTGLRLWPALATWPTQHPTTCWPGPRCQRRHIGVTGPALQHRCQWW
jgi:hypothetical protein